MDAMAMLPIYIIFTDIIVGEFMLLVHDGAAAPIENTDCEVCFVCLLFVCFIKQPGLPVRKYYSEGTSAC